VKVIIIGGTGTISEPVVRRLVASGHEVLIFNRGKRAEPPEGARFITGDRRDPRFAQTMRAHAPYDCVVDMICFTPDDARTDVEVFTGLAPQLVFTSTVDVYRKDCLTKYLDLPAMETTEFAPRAGFAYALNKVACEQVFREATGASRQAELAVTTIRPALTYREGSVPFHPLWGGSSQLDRIVKGKPIILHGDGTSLWTALHAEDAAVAYENAIGNEAAYGKGYTISSDDWMSWEYYWRVVAHVLGNDDPRFVHIPTDVLVRLAPELANWLPVHFQFHAIFDTSAARRDLGFDPQIRWEEGAARCVRWIREHGGFDSSDDHPEYDRIVEAWEGCIARMHEAMGGTDAS